MSLSSSLEAKEAGDLVYVIGTTNQDEIGGSEFIAMRGEQDTGTRYIGGKVPKTNLKTNQSAYSSLENAISNGYVSSACSVEIGGLGIALAKTAIGGQLGIYINLSKLIVTHTEHSEELREDYLLFSESTGRLVITIAPQFQEEFETAMGNHATQIGKVTQNKQFTIKNRNNAEYCIDLDLSIMEENYKSMSKELSNLQEAT